MLWNLSGFVVASVITYKAFSYILFHSCFKQNKSTTVWKKVLEENCSPLPLKSHYLLNFAVESSSRQKANKLWTKSCHQLKMTLLIKMSSIIFQNSVKCLVGSVLSVTGNPQLASWSPQWYRIQHWPSYKFKRRIKKQNEMKLYLKTA